MKKHLLAALAVILLAHLPAEAARHEDWSRLRVGQSVEVSTKRVDARGHVAEEIDIRERERGGDCEFIAPVEAFDPSSGTLMLFGAAMALGAECRVEDGRGEPLSVSGLAPGAWIEADGTFREPDRIELRRVRLLDAPPRKKEIEGPVTALDLGTGTASVAGIAVHLRSKTEIRGGVEPEPEPIVRRRIDDDDSRAGVLRVWKNRLVVGGKLEAGVRPENDFDLNPDRPGDLTTSQGLAEVEVDAFLTTELSVFGKGGITREVILRDEKKNKVGGTSRRLQQLYLAWEPSRWRFFALQIGRQDFDEDREWLYDENLDGIRVHVLRGPARLEASVSTRWNTHSPRLRDWQNWILYSEVQASRKWTTGAYLIRRTRRDDDGNRPVWLGLRSSGEGPSGLEHWLEAALLRGRYEGELMNAYGFDVGARWELRHDPRIFLVGGFARGSGGEDPSRRFHQTGLEDNNDKFGGVASYRYYGELLDPELSNLDVMTAGGGLRPTGDSSVELVYHRYRQVRADTNLGRTDLESRPAGLDREVGSEWDLLVAFEEIAQVDVEYVFSVFRPGGAFPSTAGSALLHKLEVKFYF